MVNDQRLIEDYIPIEAISEESRREKSIRKGHISTLHLWWARRPLVASRAAVYGALVPAPVNKKKAKESQDFVAELCKYPGSSRTIEQAQQHILAAHAERLSAEQGETVTIADIEAGRAPKPRVLDMFAGGGAIPLEALRLGCEAYALDLNPVAHIIQLCTLVFPQQYGEQDPASVGSAEDGSWAGLAREVEYWGNWVLKLVKAEIGDLYKSIPDPRQPKPNENKQLRMNLSVKESQASYDAQANMLMPIAYLWTRTVQCKNPACGGTVPLARRTWLCKKKDYYAALKPDAETNKNKPAFEKKVVFRLVESASSQGLGFDPNSGSKGGNVPCPFCGTVVDTEYVRKKGKEGQIGTQPMASIYSKKKEAGKVYLDYLQTPPDQWPEQRNVLQRIREIELQEPGLMAPLTAPYESIESNPRSMDTHNYGFKTWSDLFTPRQLLAMLSFAQVVRQVYKHAIEDGYDEDHAKAVATYMGIVLSRISDYNNSFCTLVPSGGRGIRQLFVRQSVAMVWDFAESNPLNPVSASWNSMLSSVVLALEKLRLSSQPAIVNRATATNTYYPDNFFDAIVTDPPYYDNVSYSNLSDFFYVWLKRGLQHLYPEHFSSLLTPKKKEAIAAFYRHEGNRDAAKKYYEEMMLGAFMEAGRVLKKGDPLIIVYAHKTTLGWSTLVDALRQAGFTVTEAWPIDTEQSHRSRAMDTASLASSIFLVARSRENHDVGSYESQVLPELREIVSERVQSLWTLGITGADLVISCVGAGLSAFTRYARVQYANGEEVPAESYLTEVEGAVLEGLLERIFGVNQAGVSMVDAVTRFYVLWRYTYRHAAIDAGEAIIFVYPQQVELDGPRGLTDGSNPLVLKKGSKYQLLDFTSRGDDETLGLPRPGTETPLIDVLHRLLYLVENQPHAIPAYLDQARPDLERLRIVAQTLAGQTLAGNGDGGGKSLVVARGAEASALRKLTTNWRTLVDQHRGSLV